MKCWCGAFLSGSLCLGCDTHFVDCNCREPEVSRKKRGLTDHERMVLMLYAFHGSTKMVAEILGHSPNTTRNTLFTIRHKLGVDTTIQALLVILGEEQAA